jgi:hypothetical protein
MTSTRQTTYLLFLSIILAMALAGCSSSGATVSPPSDMIGSWAGSGRSMISDEYLSQKDIPIELHVMTNGTVSGKIGEAEFTKASLVKTPWYMVLFGKDKYRVAFDLGGSIVSRENFRRKGGTIYFTKFSQEEIVCSFTSYGSQVKSDELVLSVKDIFLSRMTQQE